MYFELQGTNIRILGTMHLFPPDCPTVPDFVMQAYGWCDRLVLEGDGDGVLEFMKGAGKERLRKGVSAHAWQHLKKIWPPQEPAKPFFTQLQPWGVWLIAGTIATPTVPGVEPSLTKVAKADNKPIEYLETSADLAAAMVSIPFDDLFAGIELLARDHEHLLRSSRRLFDAWRAQNLELARNEIDNMPGMTEGISQAMITVRNKAWLPRLNKLISSQERVLVAIGAAHLAGPSNIFELLGVEPMLIGC